jgi:hypothetical protein
MKNSFSILIIVLLYSNSIYTKDLDFKDGFKQGYGMGYCKEDRLKDPSFDCRIYHPFNVSIPEPQEGKDSYKDGYEIGYNKGMEDYKSNFDWNIFKILTVVIIYILLSSLIIFIIWGPKFIGGIVFILVTFGGWFGSYYLLENYYQNIHDHYDYLIIITLIVSFIITLILFSIIGNFKTSLFEKSSIIDYLKDHKKLISENSKKFKLLEKDYQRFKTIFDKQEILNNLYEEFDKNKNGTIDLFEVKGEINQLIVKHKVLIIERGKEYNQNFINNLVKVENFLNEKSKNINDFLKLITKKIKKEFSEKKLKQFYDNTYGSNEVLKNLLTNPRKTFSVIDKILNEEESEGLIKLEIPDIELVKDKRIVGYIDGIYYGQKNIESDIKQLGEDYISQRDFLRIEIHSYNLILYHSLHLINSIVEDDFHTFNIIYERLDKLNIFNSNWENEVSEKLTQIELNLGNLITELRQIGQGIINSIEDLTFVTENGNDMLSDKLGEINSGINVNNLLTSINTYQNYKINQKTKPFRR